MATAPKTSEHLRRILLGAATAVIGLVERSAGSDFDQVRDRHPFLAEYGIAIADSVPRGMGWSESLAWWIDDLQNWEQRYAAELPLLRLDALASVRERLAYGIVALPIDDLRWGGIARELQAPYDTFTFAPQTVSAALDAPGERATLRLTDRLVERGVLEAAQPGSTTLGVKVSLALWRLVRDENDSGWARSRHGEVETLAHWDGSRRDELIDACRALADGSYDTLVVRSVPGADVAASLDAAFAEIATPVLWSTQEDVGSGGALSAATVRGAIPAITLQLRPGAEVANPRPSWYQGPLLVAAGRMGGIAPAGDRRLRIDVDRSSWSERSRFWSAISPKPAPSPETLASAFVLPDGHLRTIAGDATVRARVEGRRAARLDDLRHAAAEIGQHALETRAIAVATDHLGWNDLVVADSISEDLHELATRCRLREQLARGQMGRGATGVRALMLGPSGVGKTLAATVLAASIDHNVYRVDLSAIFDKYVGETEKNLDAVLAAAEQLDCVLIVDEGDSLLGSRTDGSSANDRYANLETNFLLQRIEEYSGIIVVTSNAGDRIDSAFARRMDATITFTRPQVAQRRQLWQLHLPDGHGLEPDDMDTLARAHRLTGAQIQNAVVHARMLGIDANRDLDLDLAIVEQAVLAEYRKAGRLPQSKPTAISRAAQQRAAFAKQLKDRERPKVGG